MLPYGTKIRSTRFDKQGVVVGWGTLQWPDGTYTSGDHDVPQAVYLVQVEEASNSLTGPACLVFRWDMIEEVRD